MAAISSHCPIGSDQKVDVLPNHLKKSANAH